MAQDSLFLVIPDQQRNKTKMKLVRCFSIVVCVTGLLLAGCKSSTCCSADAAAKSSCGMQCCADAKTDCAKCPKCSAKK